MVYRPPSTPYTLSSFPKHGSNLAHLKVPSIYSTNVGRRFSFVKELENCGVVLSSESISRHVVAPVP
jgi:hypothetical protein